MRYFDYQCGSQMGVVWSMFKDLGSISDYDQDPREKGRCMYSHTLEIVSRFMNKADKGVSLTDEEFCLRAYELKCQENDNIQQIKDAETVLSIVDESDESEESRVGFGQVSSRNLKSYEELFSQIEDIDEFERYFKTLHSINKMYIAEQGVDLVTLLSSALRGIPAAVEHLKVIVRKDSKVLDTITKLCEGSSDGFLLRQLETSVAFN